MPRLIETLCLQRLTYFYIGIPIYHQCTQHSPLNIWCLRLQMTIRKVLRQQSALAPPTITSLFLHNNEALLPLIQFSPLLQLNPP